MYVHSSESGLASPDHLRAVAAPAVARPRRLIRRYPNRKLYDTKTCGYVNLGDLAEMIRDGEDVEVREAETHRDLTGMVLAHVISAEERREARGGGRALAALIRDPRTPAPAAAPAPALRSVTGGSGRARGTFTVRPEPVEGGTGGIPQLDSRTDALLNEGHRLTACLRAMAAASREAVVQLQLRSNARADASHDVVAALAKLKRELARIGRTIDLLHHRLREIEK